MEGGRGGWEVLSNLIGHISNVQAQKLMSCKKEEQEEKKKGEEEQEKEEKQKEEEQEEAFPCKWDKDCI